MNYAGIYRKQINKVAGHERNLMQTILIQCNYLDNPGYDFQGETIDLKRGQWPTCYEEVADMTGLSLDQVRYHLKKSSLISVKGLPGKGIVITVKFVDRWLVEAEKSPEVTPEQLLTKEKELFKEEVNTLSSYYKSKIRADAKLTDKAIGFIIRQLKEHSVSEIAEAIDNFSRDYWWMENNSFREMWWFFQRGPGLRDRMDEFIRMKPRRRTGELQPSEEVVYEKVGA